MIDSPAFIAIIDDDPSVCRALQRLVRSLGMRASTFPSGESFFHAVASVEKPDCVVVDVQMPGMNGLEVQQRMVQEHPEIPLIFMTAHTDEVVAKRVVALGAVGFLNKPFADSLLIELIQRALHRPGENGPASSGEVRMNRGRDGHRSSGIRPKSNSDRGCDPGTVSRPEAIGLRQRHAWAARNRLFVQSFSQRAAHEYEKATVHWTGARRPRHGRWQPAPGSGRAALHSRSRAMRETVSERLQAVAEKLGLTDEQRTKIREAHTAYAEKYQTCRAQRRELLQSELKALGEVLTPEQREVAKGYVEDLKSAVASLSRMGPRSARSARRSPTAFTRRSRKSI